MERVSRNDITPLVFESRMTTDEASQTINFAEYKRKAQTLGRNKEITDNKDTVIDSWMLDNVPGYRESIAHLLPPVVVADRADAVVNIESEEYRMKIEAQHRMKRDALSAWKREKTETETEHSTKTDSSELSGMTPRERSEYYTKNAWKRS